MVDQQAIADTLGLNSQIQFPATGSSGGIVIMWDNSALGIQDIDILPQAIHVAVKVTNPPLLGTLLPFIPTIAMSLGKTFGPTRPFSLSPLETPLGLLVGTSIKSLKP